MSISSLLYVGLGGAVGACLRVMAAQIITERASNISQLGTFAVNVIGCFLMGLLWGFGEKIQLSLTLRLILISGGLGAFTTFSTFALDAITLSKTRGITPAILYVLGSNIAGILALLIGHSLSQK